MLYRKAIGEILRFFWSHSLLCWILFPFVFLFQGVRWIRKGIAKLYPLPCKIPMCVVGNLRVGGTGKTPFVIWLVTTLKKQGYKVGVVSYPYLAPMQKKIPIVATSRYDYRILGDEAALIGTLTHCPIAVASSRTIAAQALMNEHPDLDFMIFDDGLQCPGLKPSIKIALFQEDHGNGHMLPMGPLRDSWSSLDDVDFLYRVSNYPATQAAIVKKNIDYVFHHAKKEKRYLTSFDQASAIIAIAYPQALIAHLQNYLYPLDLHLFEDHQSLDPAFYKKLCFDHDVIVTQKEWIKMKDHLQPSDRVWILPLEIEVDPFIKDILIKKFAKEYHAYHASSD